MPNYPDVVLDVTTDDSHVDLVAAGNDAGIQFGECIAQDMVAVRVSPDHAVDTGQSIHLTTHDTLMRQFAPPLRLVQPRSNEERPEGGRDDGPDADAVDPNRLDWNTS